MSYFGVLNAEGSKGPFAIRESHINIWCLPRRPYRHGFILDVGLAVEPSNEDLSVLEVIVPFGTTSTAEDLGALLLDRPRVCDLVFGGPSGADANNKTITPHDHDNEVWQVRPIDATPNKSQRDPDRSTRSVSVWKIHLQTPAPAGETSYIRFRLRVTGLGRTWLWRRWALTRTGALVDLRFYDLRESVPVKNADNYANRLVSIDKLFCFVVAPTRYWARRAEPDLNHVRLLEGDNWRDYLGRASPRRLDKMAIHYWRSSEQVCAQNEFRAWLDLSVERSTFSLLTAAMVGLIVGSLLIAISTPEQLQASIGWQGLGDIFGYLGGQKSKLFWIVGIFVAVIGFGANFSQVSTWVREFWRKFQARTRQS